MDKKTQKTKQCGTIKTNSPATPMHVVPHSPWQLLFQGSRNEERVSLRKITADLKARGHKHSFSAINNWIHSKKGTPPLHTYTVDLNNDIAEIIGADPYDLLEAFNLSIAITPDDDSLQHSKKKTSAVSRSHLEARVKSTHSSLVNAIQDHHSNTLTKEEVISIITAVMDASDFLHDRIMSPTHDQIKDLARTTLTST